MNYSNEVLIEHCYICFTTNIERDCYCERCDNLYCEDCSSIFTVHNQMDGNCCYICAEQNRKIKLDKTEIRLNKLKLWNLYIK